MTPLLLLWTAGPATAGSVTTIPASEVVKIPVDEAVLAAVLGPEAIAACPAPQACSLVLAPGLVLMVEGRERTLAVVRPQLWLPASARQWHDLHHPEVAVGAPFGWHTPAPLAARWEEVPDPVGAPAASLAVWRSPTPSLGTHTSVRGGQLVIDGADGPWSPAGRAGLRSGDVLLRVGGTEVASGTELQAAMAGAGADVVVEAARGGERLSVVVHPVRPTSCWKVWHPSGVDGPVEAPPADGVPIVCPAGASDLLGSP